MQCLCPVILSISNLLNLCLHRITELAWIVLWGDICFPLVLPVWGFTSQSSEVTQEDLLFFKCTNFSDVPWISIWEQHHFWVGGGGVKLPSLLRALCIDVKGEQCVCVCMGLGVHHIVRPMWLESDKGSDRIDGRASLNPATVYLDIATGGRVNSECTPVPEKPETRDLSWCQTSQERFSGLRSVLCVTSLGVTLQGNATDWWSQICNPALKEMVNTDPD